MKQSILHISCVLASLSLFLILLICSADYCIYVRRGFYEKTYKKYEVTEYADMELSEVLRVSDYLISYLRGNEDSLEEFEAVVGGQRRLFYSEREKSHMADVRALFIGAIWIRRICLLYLLLFGAGLAWKGRHRIRTFVLYIQNVFIALCAAIGLLVVMISTDFNRAFLTFHKLFFRNDMWLLNPDEDWVIRLLPEGFFLDMCISIAITFAISLLAVLGGCGIWLHRSKDKDSKQSELPHALAH